MKSLINSGRNATGLSPEPRRLFIFAAYDRDNRIDDTLLYYLGELSKLGDIVFTMDNDVPESELSKLSKIPNIIHKNAIRHGEYDFGSYKRGYQWALQNKIFDKYDWVYLVNDSVYGPLWDLSESLGVLEKSGTDFVGMVSNNNGIAALHIQSWFIGFQNNIVTMPYFQNFMKNIEHQPQKKLIVYKYEVYLTQMLMHHNHRFRVIYDNGGLHMYNNPFFVLQQSVPFIKKTVVQTNERLSFVYQFASENVISKALDVGTIKKIAQEQDKLDRYRYGKSFRLTLFGCPIITIFKQPAEKFTAYKVYLFDKIPVFKVFLQKV